MVIYEDTRNQIGKHKIKNQWFAANGVKVYRTKVPVGDYALSTDLSICIDTKKDLQELCGNACSKQHKRFVNELRKAQELGIQLIILCEHGCEITCLEDVQHWKNPRLKNNPKATTGDRLYKTLSTMETRYHCRFLFCTKEDAGGEIIKLLLNRGGEEDVIRDFEQVRECQAAK